MTSGHVHLESFGATDKLRPERSDKLRLFTHRQLNVPGHHAISFYSTHLQHAQAEGTGNSRCAKLAATRLPCKFQNEPKPPGGSFGYPGEPGTTETYFETLGRRLNHALNPDGRLAKFQNEPKPVLHGTRGARALSGSTKVPGVRKSACAMTDLCGPPPPRVNLKGS